MEFATLCDQMAPSLNIFKAQAPMLLTIKGLPALSLRARMLSRCHVNHTTQKAFLIFKLGRDSNNFDIPSWQEHRSHEGKGREGTLQLESSQRLPRGTSGRVQPHSPLCRSLVLKEHGSPVSSFQQWGGAFLTNIHHFLFQSFVYNPATGLFLDWLLPCKKHRRLL